MIQGSRKRRITQGSGTQVQDLNRLLKQHKQMQKMMKKMKGGGMEKMMRGLGGMMGGPGGQGGPGGHAVPLGLAGCLFSKLDARRLGLRGLSGPPPVEFA